jgi:hypothetical protein
MNAAEANGTADQVNFSIPGVAPEAQSGRKARGKVKAKGPSAAVKRSRRPHGRLTHRQWSAIALGGVGLSLMALSVSHCTEAISLLTGASTVQSALLAIGVDAGMVWSEWALLTAHGCKDAPEVSRWSNRYILATVALSILLNAYAFGLHAASGMVWASWLLGAFVPLAIYTLGRVAGTQWLSRL